MKRNRFPLITTYPLPPNRVPVHIRRGIIHLGAVGEVEKQGGESLVFKLDSTFVRPSLGAQTFGLSPLLPASLQTPISRLIKLSPFEP